MSKKCNQSSSPPSLSPPLSFSPHNKPGNFPRRLCSKFKILHFFKPPMVVGNFSYPLSPSPPPLSLPLSLLPPHNKPGNFPRRLCSKFKILHFFNPPMVVGNFSNLGFWLDKSTTSFFFHFDSVNFWSRVFLNIWRGEREEGERGERRGGKRKRREKEGE